MVYEPLPAVTLFGGTYCSYSTEMENIYKNEVMRTQPLHLTEPKPNSEFLILRSCCVPDAIQGAEGIQDE